MRERVPFRGNIASRVFHKAECRYYRCKNCKNEFFSRKEAREAGYKPCKKCEPERKEKARETI